MFVLLSWTMHYVFGLDSWYSYSLRASCIAFGGSDAVHPLPWRSSCDLHCAPNSVCSCNSNLVDHCFQLCTRMTRGDGPNSWITVISRSVNNSIIICRCLLWIYSYYFHYHCGCTTTWEVWAFACAMQVMQSPALGAMFLINLLLDCCLYCSNTWEVEWLISGQHTVRWLRSNNCHLCSHITLSATPLTLWIWKLGSSHKIRCMQQFPSTSVHNVTLVTRSHCALSWYSTPGTWAWCCSW